VPASRGVSGAAECRGVVRGRLPTRTAVAGLPSAGRCDPVAPEVHRVHLRRGQSLPSQLAGLYVDDAGEALVFRVENQGVAFWVCGWRTWMWWILRS
jgi:hypothetical protein